METIEELGKKGMELTFLFSRNFLLLSLLRGTKEIKRWDHTFNEKRLNWLHLYPRSLQIHFLPISFPLFPSRVSRDYRLHTLYYYSFHSRRWFFRRFFLCTYENKFTWRCFWRIFHGWSGWTGKSSRKYQINFRNSTILSFPDPPFLLLNHFSHFHSVTFTLST